MAPGLLGSPGMDVMTATTTLVALLGLQNEFVTPGNDDKETGDFAFLEAIYKDVNSVVAQSPFSRGRSTQQALLYCHSTQQRLTRILESLGYKDLKHSSRRLHRWKYAIRLRFKRNKLRRAKADYYDAVILLRDIAMDAVTHKHLEHMRMELDDILRRKDGFPIELSNPGSPATNNSLGIVPPVSPSTTLGAQSTPAGRNDFGIGPWIVEILRVCDEKLDRVPALATPDTGSHFNLLSRNYLSKIGASHITLTEMESEITLSGVQNATFKVKMRAKVHWTMLDCTAMLVEDFLVVDEAAFDILLGMPFIKKHSALKLNSESDIFVAMSKPGTTNPPPEVLAEQNRVAADKGPDEDSLDLIEMATRKKYGRRAHTRRTPHARSGAASTVSHASSTTVGAHAPPEPADPNAPVPTTAGAAARPDPRSTTSSL